MFKSKKHVCGLCQKVAIPELEPMKGHWLIELILWFCWILPGVLYSIWRRASRKLCCPECGSIGTTLPINSRGGKAVVKRYATMMAKKNNPDLTGLV